MSVRSRRNMVTGYVLVAVAIAALATACRSSAPLAVQGVPLATPAATATVTFAPDGVDTLGSSPAGSGAGLAVVTQELTGRPSLAPLSATTVEGRPISRQDMMAGAPLEHQWLDDASGMWAMLGQSKLVASEHYSDTSTEGWVTITRDGEEIYRIDTGAPRPMSAIQGFFVYDDHWVLETNYYTDDRPFAGTITVDGVLLNEQEGYDQAFNAQTIAGKLLYLYEHEGKIDAWYDGQLIPLGYEEVPHYACCSAGEMNPYRGQDVVSFFAVGQGTWYLVQIGTPSALTP
jgi:hypothetical protein